MKTLKNTLLSLCAVAVMGALTVANAQYFNFVVPGVDGFVNTNDVSASGSINFLTGQVIMTNTTVQPSSIVKFYILKPTADTTYNEGNNIFTVPTHPDPWKATVANYGAVTGGLGVDGTASMYFGAEKQPAGGTGIATNPDNYNPLAFAFQLGGGWQSWANLGQDWIDYANQADIAEFLTIPHIIIRWQSVGDDLEDSRKGYGYFTMSDEPPPVLVPEPSEIAAMGLLGMLGLLWTRRWFLKRKKK